MLTLFEPREARKSRNWSLLRLLEKYERNVKIEGGKIRGWIFNPCQRVKWGYLYLFLTRRRSNLNSHMKKALPHLPLSPKMLWNDEIVYILILFWRDDIVHRYDYMRYHKGSSILSKALTKKKKGYVNEISKI